MKGGACVSLAPKGMQRESVQARSTSYVYVCPLNVATQQLTVFMTTCLEQFMGKTSTSQINDNNNNNNDGGDDSKDGRN